MRVVIVEDHTLFRDLLRKVCAVALGLTVVGEADSCERAKRLVAQTRPDLVILDLHLPDGDGCEVAHFVRSRWPAVAVLTISSHCDDYTLFQVEQSGAQGFIDKNTQSLITLKNAVDALRRGETYYSRSYVDAKRARTKDPNNFTKILSERECLVLSLVGQSMSDPEIARRLEISPTTAQTHRSHIMRKIGVSSSPKLIQFAIERGFTRVINQRNGKPVLA